MDDLAILLVDDDDLLCDMVVQLLELEGAQVTVVHDGQQGLAACRTARFDCILLDLIMPRMDGFQFLRQLEAEQAEHPPVVVMSASVTSAMLRDRQGDRVRGMIRKPVEAGQLVDAIRHAVAPG